MSVWGIIGIIAGALVLLWLITVLIYWFNLDSKAVKALQPVLDKHYDSMKRDRKL